MNDTPENQQKNASPKTQKLSDSKKYGLLVIAGILLIGAYFWLKQIDINQTYNHNAVANTTDNNKPIPKGETLKTEKLKIFPSDQILGDTSEKPLITMIEYGSMTCPHCAVFHTTILPMIEENYINPKKIQYIFRDYPLDGAALKATLLSKCDMSKRQAFLDLLYKKQQEWTKGATIADIEKNLLVIGKMGGLSEEIITKCLNDTEIINDTLTIQQESTKLYAIEATPTILINNQKFSGNIDIDDFKAIFDSLLAKKSDAETSSVTPTQ
jgi:protein-disulfide isomerase